MEQEHAQPEDDHTLRNVAMGAAAGIPMASKLWAPRREAMPSTRQLSFDELKANLRPRDIVMSGSTNNAMNKFMVGLGTSEPQRSDCPRISRVGHDLEQRLQDAQGRHAGSGRARKLRLQEIARPHARSSREDQEVA